MVTDTAQPQPGIAQRIAQRIVRVAGRVPGLKRAALHPLVTVTGYSIATAAGLVWGGLLSVGRLEEQRGVIVARGCPSWAFGRGGTTIGAVFLTRDQLSPDVLDHEAVHRAQWKRYGLALIPLYVAAGPIAQANRFEVEAGLEKGGLLVSIAGHTIVITGASSGIGREAAIALAAGGARIAVVGRNAERTASVAAEVGGRAFVADFDRLDDVRHLADALLSAYDSINVLANNAGGLVPTRALTVDGHERTFQSNHLAPFLLTNLLLPRLIESSARVISTSSVLNRRSALRLDDLDWEHRLWLGGWRAYGTSKLETILFIEELARRTARTGLTAYSFHPGLVATRFGAGSPLMRLVALASRGQYGISAAAGAVPLVQLASTPDVGAPSGTYFDTLTPNGERHRLSGDAELARHLWEASSGLVGLLPPH